MVTERVTAAVDPKLKKQLEQIARNEGWTNADGEVNRSKATRHILQLGIEQYQNE